MLDLLIVAVNKAANPFALIGYIVLGVIATSAWRAAKYGFMWGVAVYFVSVATEPVGLGNVQVLAATGVLYLIGAVIVTLGVFYLYRLLRRGQGGGGGGGPKPKRPPSHLRRVK